MQTISNNAGRAASTGCLDTAAAQLGTNGRVSYHKYLIYNKSLIDPEAALSQILLISLCLLPDSCLHYNFRPFVHSGQKPKEALNESELP